MSYLFDTGESKTRWITQPDGSTTKARIPKIERRYLMDKTGVFPTGLIYLVEQYCSHHNIKLKKIDNRVRPEKGTITTDKSLFESLAALGITPYPEQLEASVIAAAEERGIIVGPTGLGKSIIAALIYDQFRVKSLMVVPKVDLQDQLTDTLNQLFGRGTAGPMVNGKAVYPITVENVDGIKPTDDITGVDLVIVDEFHHAAAATYRELDAQLFNTIYWKFGMTATPFRSNTNEHLLLEAMLSEEIYRIPYKLAVDRGYIVPMEVYYVRAPKLKIKGSYAKYDTAYKKLLVRNEDRNNMIADIVGNLCDENKSTLVLCKYIEHGEEIRSLMMDRGFSIPFAEGKNQLKKEIIRDFNEERETCLLGTVGVLGEGVDTKPAEYIVIAGGGKSKIQFMQNVGRGFRNFPGKESCKIILIKDEGNEWFEEHFDLWMQYLSEEYGVEAIELSLNS